MKRLLLILIVSIGCGAAIYAEDSNKDMTSQILESWIDYLHSWNNTSVEYDEIMTDSGETFLNVHYEVTYCYPYVIQKSYPREISESPYQETQYETVTVVNPSYTFRLIKKPGETVWAIDSLEQNESTQNLEDSIQLPVHSGNRSQLEWTVGTTFARGLMAPPADWFPEAFAQDELKIVDVQKTEDAGEALVNIRYDYQPTVKREGSLLRGGNLSLMPENSWLLKNGTVILEDSAESVETEIQCEYDFSAENTPRLLHHKVRLVEHNQTIERNYSNYRKVAAADVDKDMFYLKGYQLPEPDFGETFVSCLRSISVAAGLLLIGLGAWRIYRKRRAKLGA